MNRNERLILLLLSALNFTHILDFMILMPLGNYLIPYFNITPQQFAMLVSAYTISAAVSGFTAAFYVDNFDRKKILLYAYLGFLIGTLACGLAPSFILLFVARVVTGLFGGLIGAQVVSIISDIFPYERRGRAMGAIMSAFAVASTLGVPFALYLANLISWHAPFLLVGGLGFVVIPLLMRYIPPMRGHLQDRESPPLSKMTVLTNILSEPLQRNALIFSGLVMFGHFIIIPFINPYLEFNIGYSKNMTPLVYLFGGISSFISANILGRISDKYGKLNVFSICVIAAIPMILTITHISYVYFVWMLILFAGWFSASTGRGVTAQAMVSQIVNPENRGSFQSFNSSIQQLGSGLASLVAGYVVVKGDNNRIENFSWVGIMSIIVLSICLLMARQIFKTIDK
jgi:predicted MFS family arabinose efflux permease